MAEPDIKNIKTMSREELEQAQSDALEYISDKGQYVDFMLWLGDDKNG